MPRRKLYPQGAQKVSVYWPSNVVRGLEAVAARRPQSLSLLTATIMADWLRDRGELSLPLEREETHGDGSRT